MSTVGPSVLQGAGVFAGILLTRGVFLFFVVLLVTRAVPWLTSSARHALWFCVLCGFFLLPAARLLLPEMTVHAAGAPGAVSATGTLVKALSYRDALESTIQGSGLFEARQGAAGLRSLLLCGAVIAYLSGVLFCALRSLAARLVLARLADGARPLVEHERLFRGLARRLAIRQPVRLLIHDRVSVPFTYGTLRPAVILPADSRGWPAERLRAVLTHEMAHVRRGDCLLNSIAYALCSLLWFVPLAWMARSFMRREAEMSCDHDVLSQGFPPPRYASTLLDLAAARRNGLFAGAHGFLGCRARMEERIRRILHPIAAAPWKALLVIACLACAAAASAVSIKDAERLLGTWVSLGTTGPAMYAWRGDGTEHEFARSYSSSDAGVGQRFASSLRYLPCSTGPFVIDKEWTDGHSNTWYEVRTRWTSSGAPRYALIRLDASGTSYEADESWNGYPVAFAGPIGTGMHQRYIRQ
jgi:beta-lactamase regulating signal transducer with metallopeptidase domain